ncbi:hypothetical protein Moror_5578 [Moniliophthora roreri MCA 2997]|uniref:Uncharacterized protein n=1 Tax=Moniliophthora roreri (strain MCA 2997) TaxID=1381753 RepID=V2X5T3_MONRO|nr:hypothetical protein Moror_5578 [Moniliophthora roreri MCA 2997]
MFNGNRDFAIHGGVFSNVGTQHNGNYNITNNASGGSFHVSPNYGVTNVNNGVGNTRRHHRSTVQRDAALTHASRLQHVDHHSDVPCTCRPVETGTQSQTTHQTEKKNSSSLEKSQALPNDDSELSTEQNNEDFDQRRDQYH